AQGPGRDSSRGLLIASGIFTRLVPGSPAKSLARWLHGGSQDDPRGIRAVRRRVPAFRRLPQCCPAWRRGCGIGARGARLAATAARTVTTTAQTVRPCSAGERACRRSSGRAVRCVAPRRRRKPRCRIGRRSSDCRCTSLDRADDLIELGQRGFRLAAKRLVLSDKLGIILSLPNGAAGRTTRGDFDPAYRRFDAGSYPRDAIPIHVSSIVKTRLFGKKL